MTAIADAVLAFPRSWGLMVVMRVVIVSIRAVVWWMTRRDRRRAEWLQPLRERIAGDDGWVTLTRDALLEPAGVRMSMPPGGNA